MKNSITTELDINRKAFFQTANRRLEQFLFLHDIRFDSWHKNEDDMTVWVYHDTHCEDKEILITIRKAIDASPELRSKKALIESSISGINDVDDVMMEWHSYVAVERERELVRMIRDEELCEPERKENRKFVEDAFRDGEIRTTGTDIDQLMPPVSQFGGDGARAKKKQMVIDKLKAFFDRFFGIGCSLFS